MSDDELPMPLRIQLADYFQAQGNRCYEEGKVLRPKDYTTAESKYRNSLRYMHIAAEVLAQEHYTAEVNVHKRLLAQVLIEKMAALKESLVWKQLAKPCNCSTLMMFAPCLLKKLKLIDAALIKTLEHQVSALHTCLCTAQGIDYLDATKEH